MNTQPGRLFPLDSTRWFRANVVNHPIDAPDLINNPVGNDSEHLMRDRVPVGGHKVSCLYSADGDGVFVTPFVPHHSHGAQR